MTLSPRIQSLQMGGEAWAVHAAAGEMKRAGVAVIDLTIGEHDIPTPAPILDAMDRSARAGHTGYAAIAGVPDLRAAIAARITAQSGIATGPENVLVTPGGQAALFAAHMAVLDPGQTGLYIDPYYATYPGTILATGAKAVSIPARAETGFLPDAEAIAKAARQTNARSLLINTPNNPTGALYPAETLTALGQVCADHDLWLISDEVYDGMVWSGTHTSPRALPGLAERTLVVGSMSKAFAMTGSRVGWVVGPAPAIAALADLAVHTTYGVPGYIQDAATYALGPGAGLEAEIAAPFRRRRDLAMQQLSGHAHIHCLPADGAMYLLADIRATGLTGIAFATALLEQHHVAVMPGESFGAAAAGHIRLALTVPDDQLTEALTRLAAFASAAP